jgi:hypothetical protein
MSISVYVTLLTLHRARLAYLREHPDQGSVTLEKLVITAVMIGIAVAAGAILLGKAEGKANSINP